MGTRNLLANLSDGKFQTDQPAAFLRQVRLMNDFAMPRQYRPRDQRLEQMSRRALRSKGIGQDCWT